jgi:''chromo'' (CHRromatin Organisation MOdifier) domain.
MGTELHLSTAYHPQTDGQTERVNQILEDMLRACILDFEGSWEQYLPLVEFAYNNSHQQTIGMAPFEALYGRPCRSPVCWLEVGENKLLGPEFIQDTSEKVALIRDRMRTAQSRQKSYADKRRRDLEFAVGDQVLLKISPLKGVMRFGKKGKLAPRYIGPFMITERVGSVAYRLALPDHLQRVHDVFHVSMMRKFLRDDLAYQHIDLGEIELLPDATYEERPFCILDRRDQILRSKVIPLVRVQWGHHSETESTWERESEIREKYPELFI